MHDEFEKDEFLLDGDELDETAEEAEDEDKDETEDDDDDVLDDPESGKH